jgi:hypothetical protein
MNAIPIINSFYKFATVTPPHPSPLIEPLIQPKTIISPSPTVQVKRPSFTTMDEYLALSKQGRFAPSTALMKPYMRPDANIHNPPNPPNPPK